MFQLIPALLLLLLQSQSQAGGVVAKRGSLPAFESGTAVERYSACSDLQARHALLVRLISSGASRVAFSKPLSRWILAFHAERAEPFSELSRSRKLVPILSFEPTDLVALTSTQRMRDGPLAF